MIIIIIIMGKVDVWWKINVMSNNCDLSPSVMSCKPSEK